MKLRLKVSIRYQVHVDLSIRPVCGKRLYITPLEDLLSEGTQHRPERRPTMRAFTERLRRWIRISDEFPEQNQLQWAEIQKWLFPLSAPRHTTWESVQDTILVELPGNVRDLLTFRRNVLRQVTLRWAWEQSCVHALSDSIF